MTTKKKPIYVDTELDWAEKQLSDWKEYIDDNPFLDLEDRLAYKQTANGGQIPMVIASRESQMKAIRDTMKEYLTLLKVVNEMREVEEKKREARGNNEVPARMNQD